MSYALTVAIEYALTFSALKIPRSDAYNNIDLTEYIQKEDIKFEENKNYNIFIEQYFAYSIRFKNKEKFDKILDKIYLYAVQLEAELVQYNKLDSLLDYAALTGLLYNKSDIYLESVFRTTSLPNNIYNKGLLNFINLETNVSAAITPYIKLAGDTDDQLIDIFEFANNYNKDLNKFRTKLKEKVAAFLNDNE